MNRTSFPRNRKWTPRAVMIWLLALLVMIAVGILVAAEVIGSWVLLISSGIVAVVGLLGYRAETERAVRNADDHDE